MATLFKLQAGDPVVKAYVSAGILGAIRIWQTSEEYDFELHSGHLTGYPIYIRPDGNRDTSNISKFDTLNKTATDYPSIESLANGEKLARLSIRAKNEILFIILNDWTALSELARNYWDNTPVSNKTKEEIELEAWAQRETADTGQHFEQIKRLPW